MTDTIEAKAEMLIRRPVAEVFEAFVNPDITSKFWFTRGNGRLDAGEPVEWYWEVVDSSVQVIVKALVPNERILVEWPGYAAPTALEWLFTPRDDGTTLVTITNAGFGGTPAEIVKQALDATEAFTLVLAGAKALLEHNILLNLVPDRFPDGIAED
jgi:uncharacterized protein YndB with AHSA1/START domain